MSESNVTDVVQRTLLKDDEQRDPVLGTDIISLEDKDSIGVFKTSIDRLVRDSRAVMWVGPYDPAVDLYYKDQIVVDGKFLMIANKNAWGPPAPRDSGAIYHLYDAALTPQIQNAKLLFFGLRVTVPSSGHLTGYRINTKSGQYYEIYLVKGVGVNPVFELLESFTAVSATWRGSNLTAVFFEPGDVFDLLVQTQEPDASPTTFNGDWTYRVRQNIEAPEPGQIITSVRNISVISVSYTDDALGDRTTELQALVAGDHIIGAFMKWTICVGTDRGTYIDFIVAPTQYGGPGGLQNFVFSVPASSNIDYARDVDYWDAVGATSIKGLFIWDDTWSNITPDDTAYGVDVYIQDSLRHPDWDVLSHTHEADNLEDAQAEGRWLD